MLVMAPQGSWEHSSSPPAFVTTLALSAIVANSHAQWVAGTVQAARALHAALTVLPLLPLTTISLFSFQTVLSFLGSATPEI